jgi:hypothetical protein
VGRGVIKEDVWRRFAREPKPGFTPPYYEEFLCPAELRDLLTAAYKRFYLRPRVVLRNLAGAASPLEVWRKARAGLRILSMR